MTKNRAKSASEHAQITNIWLSEPCGEKTVPMVVGLGYCRSRFEGYLGNLSLVYALSFLHLVYARWIIDILTAKRNEPQSHATMDAAEAAVSAGLSTLETDR